MILKTFSNTLKLFSHSRATRIQKIFLLTSQGDRQYFSVFHDPSTVKSNSWSFYFYHTDKYSSDCVQEQPPEMFYKKGVLKNFVKFTGKHLCQILFFNKVTSLSLQRYEKRGSGKLLDPWWWQHVLKC